jgi:hypothetical protein
LLRIIPQPANGKRWLRFRSNPSKAALPGFMAETFRTPPPTPNSPDVIPESNHHPDRSTADEIVHLSVCGLVEIAASQIQLSGDPVGLGQGKLPRLHAGIIQVACAMRGIRHVSQHGAKTSDMATHVGTVPAHCPERAPVVLKTSRNIAR